MITYKICLYICLSVYSHICSYTYIQIFIPLSIYNFNMTLFICLEVQNIFLLSGYISLYILINICISSHIPFFDRFLLFYIAPIFRENTKYSACYL